MNRPTKAVAAGAAALVIVGIGTSAVLASTTETNLNPLNDGDLDRAEHAALDHVGEGEVTASERDDDESAYEVEVTRPDGREVDVYLDIDYAILGKDEELTDDEDFDGSIDEGIDDEDRVLSDSEQQQAGQTALARVGRGTVTEVDAEDDRSVAYDVEITRNDRAGVDVQLDSDFVVVDTVADSASDDDADDPFDD